MKPPVKSNNLHVSVAPCNIAIAMDSKSTRSYLAHLAWIIPSVIALIGIALDHMDLASLLFSKIWNLFFVNVWYLWLAAAGLGLYRFVRLIQNLHNLTNKEIPALKTAHDENRSWTKELVDHESKSRVAATDTLSTRINSLDTQSRKDLTDSLTAVRSQLSELVKKEEHNRTDGINALQRELEKQFERMNKIESRSSSEAAISPAQLLATPKQDPRSAVISALIEAQSKKRT